MDDPNERVWKPSYPRPVSKNEAVFRKTRVSFSAPEGTKRVIAPYSKTGRRGQKLAADKAEESKQFSYYLQKKPSVLMRNLASLMSDSLDLVQLLNETADVLKGVTRAAGVNLYMVDEVANEIYQYEKSQTNTRHKIIWKIEEGRTVAAYVAYCKEFVLVDDVVGDERFLEGIGSKVAENIKCVLCVPVVTPTSECLAIMELYRDSTMNPFQKDDLKIVIAVTGWMGAALHQNQQRQALQKQQELNEYLLDLTTCYFADTVLTEKMIADIVGFAKITLAAERGSFFIIDRENDELVADLFDEGISEAGEQSGTFHKKNLKIRFGKERGIAGLCAQTGETINIKDAYTDPRFNHEVDSRTGFNTRSILCMPIMGMGGILGVMQVVNKKPGCGINFTTQDENLFKTFSVYCALALHYSNLHDQMHKIELLNRCYHRLIQQHLRPCNHDYKEFGRKHDLYEIPEDFQEFFWYAPPEQNAMMVQYTLYMFHEISGKSKFDNDALLEFLLGCRNSYRDNPYHNWAHGFNVAHCMYNILNRNMDFFSEIERDALLLAALCHDLDHGGVTNNFLNITNDILMELYETSPWEHHHYRMTCILLDKHRIYKDYPADDYKKFMTEVREAILATDLATYFKARSKLMQACNEGDGFDEENVNHRHLLKEIIMTTCDLSGQCKPYSVARKITDSLYREFYHQGDMEKAMGLTPLSMMDRDKQHMVPEDQVQFLTIIVMPCTESLKLVLPNTEDLHNECRNLRDTWREIIDLRGQRLWRQDDSSPNKDE